MKRVSKRQLRHTERGSATLLLLFAMSAFSVLATASMTTKLRESAAGSTYGILSGVRDGANTKFVAPLVIPNSWRLQGGKGSYAFELPVLVPEKDVQSSGATGAWHTMSESEVPGMSVCCESQGGVCRHRKQQSGEPEIADWTPGRDDAEWLSFDLGHQPGASEEADLVTATLLSAARDANAEGTSVSCQLEFQGTIVAKGYAYLTQVAREHGSQLLADHVVGSMDIAVRTR
jgi:hypothetical protein